MCRLTVVFNNIINKRNLICSCMKWAGLGIWVLQQPRLQASPLVSQREINNIFVHARFVATKTHIHIWPQNVKYSIRSSKMGICLWALNHRLALSLSLSLAYAWARCVLRLSWNGSVLSLCIELSWMSHLKLIIPLRNPTRRFYYYISMILGFFSILILSLSFSLNPCKCVCLDSLCRRRHHLIVINITVIVLDIIIFVLNYGTSSWAYRKMVCFHEKSPGRDGKREMIAWCDGFKWTTTPNVNIAYNRWRVCLCVRERRFVVGN